EDGIRDGHVTGVQTCALPIFEAIVAFPSAIAKAYPHWRVGRAVINDEEVVVIQGIDDERQPIANLYFAPSGLLMRAVRWTLTPEIGRASCRERGETWGGGGAG